MRQGSAGDLIPYVLTEELLHLIDRPDEPASIQVELRLSGTIDEGKLRSAVATAVAVHPMAQASRAAGRVLLRPPRWRIEGRRAAEVVRSQDLGSDAELSAARAEFYSRPIGLQTAPGLRLLLARRRDGDSLLLNVHHAIMDGVGSLRFLHSVARAYRGRPDPVPAVDPLAMRDLGAHFGGPRPSGPPGAGRVDVPTGAPSLIVDLPTGKRSLIAPDREREDPGYGFVHLALPSDFLRPRDAPHVGPPSTLNDRLLASLHLTIDSWNAEHGNPCRKLAVMMPVNLRPPDWRHEVAANLITTALIESTPVQRSAVGLLLPAMVRQTRWVKSRAAFASALNPPPWLQLLSLALLGVRGVRGTSMAATLSNLGRIDGPPDFGREAGEVEAVWFSPPAPMAMGLSLGAAGWRNHLHLVLRYRRALFSDEAAGRFAGCFVDALRGVCRGGAM
ncbi:hypothetical protein [Paludisphaera soli]|uniref:hypothetical protein n=1 Tax=Paludisphaera soli TaxID=2712865 RepID=UPI0013EC8BD9|nr:hypothetical protein [Paludisphaera soli]